MATKGGVTTRVWVNPRFDARGNVLDEEASNIREQSSTSSDTSVFVLEGPRESDETAILAHRVSIPMQEFGNGFE